MDDPTWGIACRIRQTHMEKRFDGWRSLRFHNAARALFSSYAAPLLPSSRLVSLSPFSRSSVGQRTFSPAAFQRAPCRASASNFFTSTIPAEIYRSIGRKMARCGRDLFLRTRGERPRVPVSAIRARRRKIAKPAHAPAEKKSVFPSFYIFFTRLRTLISLMSITVLHYEINNSGSRVRYNSKNIEVAQSEG